MARILVDEALPRSLARHLRDARRDADDVRDLGLRGQPDERVFREAQDRDAILITRDLGFTNVLRFPPTTHKGLIIVRLPNTVSTARLIEQVLEGLRDAPLDTLARSVLIIEPGRTRLRRFD